MTPIPQGHMKKLLLISTNFQNLPHNVSHHIFLSRITARSFYYKWHDAEIANIKEYKIKIESQMQKRRIGSNFAFVFSLKNQIFRTGSFE